VQYFRAVQVALSENKQILQSGRTDRFLMQIDKLALGE
jgi:hypothetical protein